MRKLVIMLLFLVPMLSGCANVYSELSLNKDNSANITVVMQSKKPVHPLELATMKSNYKKFLDKKYEIKNISAKNNLRYKAQKSVKKISKSDLDLSSLGFKTKLKSGRYIDVRHNIFVTSYNINMVYDIKQQMNRVKRATNKNSEKTQSVKAALYPEYFQKYADKELLIDDSSNTRQDFIANFEPNEISESEVTQNNDSKTQKEKKYTPFNLDNLKMTFAIALPMPASYNNSDSQKIAKKSLYFWEIKKDAPTEIKLQYVVYSGFSITFMIILGILLLVYVAYRIWRHDNLKRIGNNN